MKLSSTFNQIKNPKPMNGLKFILFFSVLFIMINSAHGNSPQAISGKDSLIIIFKGPTIEQDESIINNTDRSIVSNLAAHFELAENLINHFQPDNMENLSARMLSMHPVFAPNNSSFSHQSDGILNFSNSYENSRITRKKGIME
jgi:hypothetical protein